MNILVNERVNVAYAEKKLVFIYLVYSRQSKIAVRFKLN